MGLLPVRQERIFLGLGHMDMPAPPGAHERCGKMSGVQTIICDKGTINLVGVHRIGFPGGSNAGEGGA
jgi:hypothetical protein